MTATPTRIVTDLEFLLEKTEADLVELNDHGGDFFTRREIAQWQDQMSALIKTIRESRASNTIDAIKLRKQIADCRRLADAKVLDLADMAGEIRTATGIPASEIEPPHLSAFMFETHKRMGYFSPPVLTLSRVDRFSELLAIAQSTVLFIPPQLAEANQLVLEFRREARNLSEALVPFVSLPQTPDEHDLFLKAKEIADGIASGQKTALSESECRMFDLQNNTAVCKLSAEFFTVYKRMSVSFAQASMQREAFLQQESGRAASP